MRNACWRCSLLLGALGWLCSASPGEIPQAELQAARKTVEDTFGEILHKVRATSSKDDDLQTAGDLLDAAAGPGAKPAVQAELARRVMELATPIGTPKAAAVAERALKTWSDLVQPGELERCRRLTDIRLAELQNVRPEERRQVTRAAAEALGDLAAAHEQAKDYDAAAAHLTRAIGLARSVNLKALEEDLQELNLQLQRVRSFKRDLEAANQRLEAAAAGNNPALITATNEKIGMLYLLRMGDPASASPYLAKAGHAWAAPAESLRKRSADKHKKGLSVPECIQAATMLRAAAGQAELLAKPALLESIVGLCDEAQENVQGNSPEAVQLELLRQQAKTMLDSLPKPRNAALRRALRALSGQVAFNPDGSVKITYAFADPKELNDWAADSPRWAVEGGKLLRKSALNRAVLNKVRFRADRPIRVTFTAADGVPAISLLSADDQVGNWRSAAQCSFGTGPGGRDCEVKGLGGQASPNARRSGNPPYAFDVTYDGKGKFTWTAGGQEVGTLQTTASRTAAGLRVGLATRQGGATYGNLVITGTPLGDSPVADAPPPPGQDPNPNPGPRRGPWRGPGRGPGG